MVLACVSTAKGAAAIAVVEVFGSGGVDVVQSIFKADGGKPCVFDIGVIYTGYITDGGEIIDHVVACRTEEDVIEISCHGNPLIVEMVMGALSKAGAKLVDAEKLISEKMTCKGGANSIEIEAAIANLKATSITGVKAIAGSDLSVVVGGWLDRIDSLSIEDIKEKCKDILAASERAKYLIGGCKAVIAGPPNSGKSTLLNWLCGREKAIVTDIAGTTRDWVSGTCRAGELVIELFDTAGLDASIIGESEIDGESQRRSLELLNECDVVLLVLDSTQPSDDFNFDVIAESGKKVITVLNKSDLGGLDDEYKKNYAGRMPAVRGSVNISAMTGDGIERLLDLIVDSLVGDGGIAKTICFTERQDSILQRICEAGNIKDAGVLISELISGKV
ncbi:MAG: 50S ribosome-binding GTPase [Phycisphaerae bacterium]|nr:50S ribosome-binding GTPase [Phycisphaerae bacterium]